MASTEPTPDQNWINMNKRVKFSSEKNCAVAKIQCFPNVERGRPGPVIYTLCAGKPEMEFMGLAEMKEDMLRSMRDREKEHKLCERMRLLGAQEFEGYFHMAPWGAMLLGGGVEPESLCSEHDYGRYGVTLMRWPKTGGVWVLKLNREGLEAVGGMKRLRNENNVDMGTQSRLIEKLEGRFYADPVECPELEFLRGPSFALAVVDE